MAGRAAGGGKGALGSWMGAVALLTKEMEPVFASGTGFIGAGAVGTRLVFVAPAGVTEVVMGRGTGDVIEGGGTGAVISFGCVRPAPGRARSVMRTVSFFRGTDAVFWTGVGGGVGWVLSLMVKKVRREGMGHHGF